MSATATAVNTIKTALDRATPGELESALAKAKLGTLFTPLLEDSGTISAAATYTLANVPLAIQSIQVVTASATNDVGDYIVGATAVRPTNHTVVGVCTISGKVITFAANVTRVKVLYLPIPDITAAMADNSKP